MIATIIISCVQSFIYDSFSTVCKNCFQKFKREKFFRELKRKIQEFFRHNESVYIDGEAFRNFIENHKPFERIMRNALAMDESEAADILISKIIIEAEESAKAVGQRLSYDDKRVLKDICTLINSEICTFYSDNFNDAQKFIISQNVRNSKKILDSFDQGNKQTIATVKEVIRGAASLTPYKAEILTGLIYKKMWLGEFTEVEQLYQIVEGKSEDVELAIKILKYEFFENDRDIKKVNEWLEHIKNSKIRNIVIRNIIPLMYFRKEKFNGLEMYTDAEYIKAIMSSLNIEEYSFLFTVVKEEDQQGIETRRIILNKKVQDAESWVVNQIVSIYLYNLQNINCVSLMADLSDPKRSWLSMLLQYSKRIDALVYEGVNDKTIKEIVNIKSLLEGKSKIYNELSNDLKALYYSLLVKAALISEEDLNNILVDIPQSIRSMRPLKDYLLSVRVDKKTIGFEEVYKFCEETEDYRLMAQYMISIKDDPTEVLRLIDEHSDLLERNETIFFIYCDTLRHLGKYKETKDYLDKFKNRYQNLFLYWDIYLEVDDSVKEEFINICDHHKIDYLNVYDNCKLVERLLNFADYDAAEFYNHRLELLENWQPIFKKYKAFILYGRKKYIDALELFKEIWDDFPDDMLVLNRILAISIECKRYIEEKYIEAAKKIENPQMMTIAAVAYASNGNYSEAKCCNMKALFMSDDCQNPAFNQYIELNIIDEKDKNYKVNSIEKDTVAELQSDKETVRYCIHGNLDIPKSPCIWNGDTQLYVEDAASIGIYRKTLGSTVVVDGICYTVKSIESIYSYIGRICFGKIVENGSAKAITVPYRDGHTDVEKFINQMREFTPDAKGEMEFMQHYNDPSNLTATFFMIKQRYNCTYTEFVERIIKDQMYCIREIVNNSCTQNNKFILSFTSLVLLKMIGVSTEYLCDNNVFSPESTAIQIAEDTSKMITHYANDSVLSMGFYDEKPYMFEANEETKDEFIKMAGELRTYVEGIPRIACKKDWKKSAFDQLDMITVLGMPDYDAISIAVSEGYTVIGTEEMVAGLCMTGEVGADVVSITNWLIYTRIDALDLIYKVKQLVSMGCVYAITDQMVQYLSDTVKALKKEDARTILSEWEALIKSYDSVDDAYRKYGIEALKCIFVSAKDKIENPGLDPVIQVFLKSILWILNIELRLNEKGEIVVEQCRRDGNNRKGTG